MISSQQTNNPTIGWRSYNNQRFAKNRVNVAKDDISLKKEKNCRKSRRTENRKKVVLLVFSVFSYLILTACTIYFVYRISHKVECTLKISDSTFPEAVLISTIVGTTLLPSTTTRVSITSLKTSMFTTTTVSTSSSTTSPSIKTSTSITTISALCPLYAVYLSNSSAYTGCKISNICFNSCNNCMSNKCATNGGGLFDCPC